ncbi:MAG: GNAT family N-acetyltransferase [Gammaproteobacteria bacterium]|nr:GNAT family N-acetyltransferase [Gammaproteobacteria bacterium]MBU0830186.1 GNAT family N-acetyltransferase [Gammaproteobacteria bacterium]MBU0892499.1 GNAT family N-acetyltransferase [Gammaproteobacteria bacterium]MBU1350408.1 GNAT family N-acetyltransferase [Gammaproteobacteria bacterium]MBU1504410.1 GNAT family N-acetyltransferase [Gammaproteobacteria bacterium]
MNIRKLHAHELMQLLDLYKHLHEHDDPLPSASAVEAVWAEVLANPRIQYLGAYVDGALVSTCTLTVVPNLTRACRPYGVIENVVTHPTYRGQGWGQAILKHALDQARQQHCYKVMLMTGRRDETTLQFYEKAGFDRRGKQAFVAKLAT